MEEPFLNGFIVTIPPERNTFPEYYGVDNETWPVEIDIMQHPELSAIADDAFTDMDTPLLIGYEAYIKYSQICKSQSMPIRGLYCEVFSQTRGVFSRELHRKFAKQERFLGFDYAYPNGDYYSAVLNDLICRRVSFQKNYTEDLNQYGLFPTMDDVKKFASARSQLKNQLKEKERKLLLEEGYFAILKLYSVPE